MGELKYFFSYARKDSEFVLKLAQELREAGVNLWLDQLDILGGRVWDREVEEALQSCQGVIAVLSPESAESKNVMDELAFALDEEKLIIPVVIRPGKMPFRLRRLQYIDFTGNYGNGFARLLKALNLDQPAAPRETGKPEAPVGPDVAEPVEESPVPAEAAEALERRTEPAESEPKVVPGLEPAGESTSIFSRRRKSPGESAEPHLTQAAPEQTHPSQTMTWRIRLLGALVGAGIMAACLMLAMIHTTMTETGQYRMIAIFGGLGALVGAICGLDKKKLVGALGGAGVGAAGGMLAALASTVPKDDRYLFSAVIGGMGALVGASCGIERTRLMGVLGGIGLAIVSGLLALSLSLVPPDNWPVGFLFWALGWMIAGAICGMERRVIAFALGGMVGGFGLIAMVAPTGEKMITGLTFGTPLGALAGAVVGRLVATWKGWGRAES